MSLAMQPDQVLESLRAGRNPDWTPGRQPVLVFTRSGSVYRVDANGIVQGGSLGTGKGRLRGAIHRPHGPIRANQILVGLSMEIITHDGVVTTTAVERLEDAE